MNLSIVIPVRNDLDDLSKCIGFIETSSQKPSEILIVDDASDMDIEGCLYDRDVSLIKLDSQRGPAHARNVGAKAAKGDVILFLDADVFLQKDTIKQINDLFEKGEDAVVGVFDDYRQYRSFFGDYKNLWMKYSYENIPKRAALFYTSLAAIRTDVFRKTGGFDENYKRPSTEDTAFGNVLWNNGIRPLINPGIKAVHNKEYSLLGFLKTDFFRASDLLKMKLRKDMGQLREGNRTSVPVFFIISVFSTIAALLVFLVTGKYYLLMLFLAVSILLNFKFLVWLFKRRGFLFAIKTSVFIPVDHLAITAGMISGLVGYFTGRRYILV
jgi:GT2 family glycosyltransferase